MMIFGLHASVLPKITPIAIRVSYLPPKCMANTTLWLLEWHKRLHWQKIPIALTNKWIVIGMIPLIQWDWSPDYPSAGHLSFFCSPISKSVFINSGSSLLRPLLSLPRKHEAFAQCWAEFGPSSSTLAQHQPNIGPAPRFCWVRDWNNAPSISPEINHCWIQ